MPQHFLTLPREIRDMIYEYCVLFDREIFPYPTWYDYSDGHTTTGQEMPCTALLAVNKTVQAEAEVLLYGKNLFKLSDYNILGLRSEWTFCHPALRHLSIKFDSRALCPEVGLDISAKYFSRLSAGSISRAQMRKDIHSDRCQALIALWATMAEFLDRLELRTLEIDFTNCYCPGGCCRLVQEICGYLNHWKWPANVPPVERVCAEQAEKLERYDPRKLADIPKKLVFRELGDFFAGGNIDPYVLAEEMGLKSGNSKDPTQMVLVTVIGLIFKEEQNYVHQRSFHCPDCFIKGKHGDKWYCSR